MVELLQKDGRYESGYRAGKIEQLRVDISLIRELATESDNFEDFKLRLRDQVKKMDRQTWF